MPISPMRCCPLANKLKWVLRQEKIFLYKITVYNNQLVYIKWQGIPLPTECTEFLTELTALLDNAVAPLAIISDLRKGHITDVQALRTLSNLASHPNVVGSSSFGDTAGTKVYGGVFSRFVGNKNNHLIRERLSLALSDLEKLKPGVTQNIDWDSLIKDRD
ncbi:MAG: hypothetical protein ABI947_03795 [Chloroflexota bacterium]